MCLVGPHRDDLTLRINAMPARTHASQGEQRSMALALRLAAHRLVADALGDVPVLLLDDVFSELDPGRTEALLHHLPPGQAVLTTAGPIPDGAEPRAGRHRDRRPAGRRSEHLAGGRWRRRAQRSPAGSDSSATARAPRPGWQPLREPGGPPPRPVADSLEPSPAISAGAGGPALVDLLNRWPEVVGEQLAAHCRPVSLRAGTLTIAADESGLGRPAGLARGRPADAVSTRLSAPAWSPVSRSASAPDKRPLWYPWKWQSGR